MPGDSSQFVDAAFFGGERAMGRPTLHVAIDLDRPYSADALTRAARETEAALPILATRYRTRWWRDRWEPHPDPPPAVEDVPAPAGIEAATLAIVRRIPDPTRERPWAIRQLRGDEGCRLVISVLHQLTDAAGALAVVREFADRLGGADPGPGWGDLPMPRGLGQMIRALRLRQLPHLALEVVDFSLLPLRYLGLGRPKQRWRSNLDRAGAESYRTLMMGVGEGTPLRDRCRRLGCTVNDALVALLAQLNERLYVGGKVGNFFTVDLRRYLGDERPRVANISGMDVVIVARSTLQDFDAAVEVVARGTRRRKRGFPGLPALLSNHASMWMLPHGLVRLLIRVWVVWACALIDRGLLVTNIGPLDRTLAPLGERAVAASVIGPWIHGFAVPILTATSFRDRLTVQINGFDGPSRPQLDAIEAGLQGLTEDWK
jgi:NRPS condensation-like uncharacterized protein